MTRILRTLGTAAAVTALLAFGFGCGGSAQESGSAASGQKKAFDLAGNVPFADSPELQVPRTLPTPKPRNLKIVFLSPRASNESLKTIADGLSAEVQNLGGTVKVLDAQLDVDTQVSQFQQAIAQHVDGIAILPLDPKALAPSLKQAHQLHIPVVGSTVDPTNPKGVPGYTTDVWEGHDRLAYEQVKEMAKLLPKGAKVVLMGSVIPVPGLVLTTDREAHWAKAFGLDVIGRVNNASDDIAGGAKAMTQALSKYPDMQGLLPYNDESAVGARSAARAAGKTDITIVGINGGSLGFGAVKHGQLQATVQTQEAQVGELMAKALYLAVEQRARRLPPAMVTANPILITPSNVSTAPTWSDEVDAIRRK